MPIDDQIDVRYAAHFFLSERGLPLIQRASPGSADRNRTLAIDRFENLEIPLPDIVEQRRTVAALDGLLGQARAIDRQLKASDPVQIVSVYPATVDPRSPTRQRNGGRSVSLWTSSTISSDLASRLSQPKHSSDFSTLSRIRDAGSGAFRSVAKGRKFRFQPGDVVYGYLRPYLNKVWVADMHGLCSVDQYVLRPKNGLPAAYLAHALRSRATLDQATALTHSLQLPRLRSRSCPPESRSRLSLRTDFAP